MSESSSWQLDREMLEEFYRQEQLLVWVGETSLFACDDDDDTHDDDSFLFLQDIHENARAVHRARQDHRVVSARRSWVSRIGGFVMDTPPNLVAKGLGALGSAGSDAARASMSKVTKINYADGANSTVSRYLRANMPQSTRVGRAVDKGADAAKKLMQGDLGVNKNLNSAVSDAATSKNLAKNQGPVFVDESADTPGELSVKLSDGSTVNVKYVKNENGNVQLTDMNSDDLTKLTNELRDPDKLKAFTKNNWELPNAPDAPDVVKRISGSEVVGDAVRKVSKTEMPVSLYGVVIEQTRDVMTRGLFKNVLDRKRWITRKTLNNESGFKMIGKEISLLSSRQTVHWPVNDLGYSFLKRKMKGLSGEQITNLNKMKQLSNARLHDDAMAVLRKQGDKVDGVDDTTEIEFNLEFKPGNEFYDDAGKVLPGKDIQTKNAEAWDKFITSEGPEPPIRIEQFKKAIDATDDPALKKHLRDLEACKVQEMLDPKLNKRVDANGLVDGDDAGDAFDVQDYVARGNAADDLKNSADVDPKVTRTMEADLKHYGSMKHQFKGGPNPTKFFDAPKHKSIEMGLVHKLQMINQTKGLPVMSKKFMKSAEWLDKPENLAKKKEVFGHLSYDICGGAKCTPDEWAEFRVMNYYQSAGLHTGNGLPLNGKRLIPEMEIGIGRGPIKARVAFDGDPHKYLFGPELDLWTDVCKKSEAGCIELTEGGKWKKFDGIPDQSRGKRFRSWLYEQTTGNTCKRFPKLCVGGFWVAVAGGLGYAYSENWKQCESRWYPADNALLTDENKKRIEEQDCSTPRECESTEEGCLDIQKDNPWSCTRDCRSNEDPNKDCCTTEVRRKCYQNCLPRNYSYENDEVRFVGSIPAVTAKMPDNGQVHSSWCMEPFHHDDEENRENFNQNTRGCKLDISDTTQATLETDVACMQRARTRYRNKFRDIKDAEVSFLECKMAYPGLVQDKRGYELPWAKDKDWATGGVCNQPDYNTNEKMLEHLLYHKGCGSIKHNKHTKEAWSKEMFKKDTGIQLPPLAECDLSSKDFDDLIIESGDVWRANEFGVFTDQPYCTKDEDDPRGGCRDYCWNMCSDVDKDISETYQFLANRAEKAQVELFNDTLKKFAITAAVIGAAIVGILLFVGSRSGGLSDEERLMQELE